MCLHCIDVVSDQNGHPLCVFCFEQLPASGLTKTHYLQCEKAKKKGKHIFAANRDDKFRNHLLNRHQIPDIGTQEATWIFDVHCGWPSRCGFCPERFNTWQERINAIAYHFEQGMDISAWKDPTQRPKDQQDDRRGDIHRKDDDDDDEDGGPDHGKGKEIRQRNNNSSLLSESSSSTAQTSEEDWPSWMYNETLDTDQWRITSREEDKFVLSPGASDLCNVIQLTTEKLQQSSDLLDHDHRAKTAEPQDSLSPPQTIHDHFQQEFFDISGTMTNNSPFGGMPTMEVFGNYYQVDLSGLEGSISSSWIDNLDPELKGHNQPYAPLSWNVQHQLQRQSPLQRFMEEPQRSFFSTAPVQSTPQRLFGGAPISTHPRAYQNRIGCPSLFTNPLISPSSSALSPPAESDRPYHNICSSQIWDEELHAMSQLGHSQVEFCFEQFQPQGYCVQLSQIQEFQDVDPEESYYDNDVGYDEIAIKTEYSADIDSRILGTKYNQHNPEQHETKQDTIKPPNLAAAILSGDRRGLSGDRNSFQELSKDIGSGNKPLTETSSIFVGQNYPIYDSLKQPDSIRLLRLLPSTSTSSELHCELFTTSLSESPKFEALSYFWGAEISPAPLHTSRGDLEITQNLASALKQLRPRSGNARLLWVDAVCIDQRALCERNHHVRLMFEIYRKASLVITWLGPEKMQRNGDGKHRNLSIGSRSCRGVDDGLTNTKRGPWKNSNFLRIPSLKISPGPLKAPAIQVSKLTTKYLDKRHYPACLSTIYAGKSLMELQGHIGQNSEVILDHLGRWILLYRLINNLERAQTRPTGYRLRIGSYSRVSCVDMPENSAMRESGTQSQPQSILGTTFSHSRILGHVEAVDEEVDQSLCLNTGFATNRIPDRSSHFVLPEMYSTRALHYTSAPLSYSMQRFLADKEDPSWKLRS
jgi:hypothetical protein